MKSTMSESDATDAAGPGPSAAAAEKLREFEVIIASGSGSRAATFCVEFLFKSKITLCMFFWVRIRT